MASFSLQKTTAIVVLIGVLILITATTPALQHDEDSKGDATDLKGDTTVSSGNMTVKEKPSSRPLVEALIRLTDDEFTDALNDPETDEYKEYKVKIETTLGNALISQNDKIKQVILNSLLPGSVVANTTIELSEDVDPSKTDTATLVKDTVKSVANSSDLGFKVDGENITTTAVEAESTTTNPSGTTGAQEVGGSTTGNQANSTAVSEETGDTTADGNSTSGSGNTATTVSASDASASNSDNTTTTEKSDSGNSSSSTPNTESASNSDNTTTTEKSDSGNSSNTTPNTGSASNSDNNTTTENSDSGNSSNATPNPGSGSNSENTTTENSNDGNSSSTGSASGSGGSDGSSSGSISSESGPVFTVKVDETSVNGKGVLVSVIATDLSNVNQYKDSTTEEYAKFSKATSKITSTLIGTSEGTKLTDIAKLKQMVIVDNATVRAEYLIPATDGINVTSLQTAINNLNQTEVFKLDSDVTTKVKVVPLAAKNRWSSCTFKITNKAYVDDMADPSTDAFKDIKKAVEPSLKKQLKNQVAAVREVYVMELRKGSVIVRSSVETLATSTDATTGDVSKAFKTINTLGTYNVDHNSTVVFPEEYIEGAQAINPVPKAALPTPKPIPTRDNEDIKKGDVKMDDDKVRFVPIKKNNYIFTVTIPAFCAVLFVIVIFLCCTTSDSFVCRICSADPKNVP